jgi:hypothetical protein
MSTTLDPRLWYQAGSDAFQLAEHGGRECVVTLRW